MCQIAPHCWDLAGCSLPGASRPFLWGLKSSLGSLNCCPSMERCFEGFALCPVVPVERNFPSLELPGLGIVVFCCLSPMHREIWEGGKMREHSRCSSQASDPAPARRKPENERILLEIGHFWGSSPGAGSS